jgi:hypothetical protein
MKYFIFSISILHGLIHILGFLKSKNILKNTTLKSKINNDWGLVWLFSSIAFILFAFAYFFTNSLTIFFGIIACSLSQMLCFKFWKDAKFGTIANFIVLIAVINLGTDERYQTLKLTNQNSLRLLNKNTNSETTAMSGIPICVEKWLIKSKILNQNYSEVYLKQNVRVKMDIEDKEWTLGNSEQILTANYPAFYWWMNMKYFPGFEINARDKFSNGIGGMIIKFNTLFNIGEEYGKKINKASMQRFMAESIWLPSIAQRKYINWENIDSLSAKATMKLNNTSVTGIYFFNNNFDFKKFECQRYKNNDSDSKELKWVAEAVEYKDINGIRIPNKVKASWYINDKKWTWIEIEIIDAIFK